MSCQTRCRPEPCLGSECGTSIHTENIPFSASKSNLVYLDKVYSYNQTESCPMLATIDTGGPNACNFEVDFTMEHPDGCCCTPTLEPDAVFHVDRSYGTLEYINTQPAGNVDRCQVSIDGVAVDCVDYVNGQYQCNIASIASEFQKDRCMDANLPTKCFFLINNVGPWSFRASFVIEGSVTTCGQCCNFKLEIKGAEGAPELALPCSCPSNFAVKDLSLPCPINGVAPVINFQFDGKIRLANPKLYVDCRRRPMPGPDCGCGPAPGITITSVALESCIVVEPSANVEVVRKSLFCLDACEALIPCEPQAALAEELRECVDPYASDCGCGSGSVAGVSSGCGCENNRVYSVTDTCSCGGRGCDRCRPQYSGGCSCGGRGCDRCRPQYGGCSCGGRGCDNCRPQYGGCSCGGRGCDACGNWGPDRDYHRPMPVHHYTGRSL